MARDHGRVDGGFDVRAAHAAHGAELHRFALRQLGDGGAAQDVVREVFLRAWRAADGYDPRLSGLRTWLLAIARHVGVAEARRFAVRPRQRTLAEGPGADVPGVVGIDEEVAAVPAGRFLGVGPAELRCDLNSSVLREDAAGFRVVAADGTVVASSEARRRRGPRGPPAPPRLRSA
jgi:DNA-directed RNA polymerase specialized sigma24 family protein